MSYSVSPSPGRFFGKFGEMGAPGEINFVPLLPIVFAGGAGILEKMSKVCAVGIGGDTFCGINVVAELPRLSAGLLLLLLLAPRKLSVRGRACCCCGCRGSSGGALLGFRGRVGGESSVGDLYKAEKTRKNGV